MGEQLVTHEIVQPRSDRDVLFEVFTNSRDVSQKHWHDALELVYVTRGTLLMEVNGHTERLDQGDCLVINSRVIHASNGSPGNDSILVQFPAEFLSRYIPDFDHCYFDLDTHNREPHHQTKLLQLKTVLENMVVVEDIQPDGGYLRFNSLLFEFLFELYHNFRIPVAPAAVTDARNTLNTMMPVIDYTAKHYMEPISIGEAASLVHLQEDYFCRKFKKLMGQTYLEYLNDVRISHVYEDLIHSDLKLAVILERHGFTNYKLFRRLFREKFGCTPGELRKREGGAGEQEIASSQASRSHIQPQMFTGNDAARKGTIREL